MSTLEEKGKIVSLSSFNAHSVMGELNIAPEMKHEMVAIRFVHSVMKSELRAQSRVTQNHAASEVTSEKISFRYELFRSFADDFFAMDHGIKMDALSTAVICDELIEHANEPLQPTPEEEESGAPHRSRNDGFDADILHSACIFFEEALHIEQMGILDDAPAFERESFFLAHVNAIGNLRDIEESFDEYSPEDLFSIRDKDLSLIPRFMNRDTQIGQCLQSYLDHMTARIDSLVPPPQKPAPKARHLTLVPTQN
ncbi:MAG: hypothetical protein DI626_07120 [Micavibrio aeruginosavorus]|uniref:Uncharacterized protein n=1 Tax=Micavibrio aeruginosavorus TaxID=349221 RepID=A0A2W4ZWD0_9BACT|nr:MAG: hypothetical protein DI626_07120 [Micavibrio aeruginosavorus]